MGQHAEAIARAATDAGHSIPDDVIPPELLDEVRFAYAAFNQIGTDRAIGFSLGPVPWSAIDAYGRRYGLDDIDEFDRFVGLIRAIESVKPPKEQ